MKRCEPDRGVHFTGVSVIQMSIPERNVHLAGDVYHTEVCTCQRFLSNKQILQGCPSKRCVCMTEMSTFQGCEPGRGVHFTGVSVIQMSIPVRSVHLAGDVYHTEVCTWQRCLSNKQIL